MIMCSYVYGGTTMKQYVKIFKTLGDDTRLGIFLLLAGGELCVCELVKTLGMEQSAVSHSLRKLEAAGIVKKKRSGKWKLYSLTDFASKDKILKCISKEINLTPALSRGLKLCEKQKVRSNCGANQRISKK
ncbi:MAG: ArsR family transcriptional regulator [Elusimicrobia bacterium HGW-Elusimicrobia-2]|nr:MAG: ArsR family transcriptional regulator [Elusimicrobia bacterium HGW-Elusimicrobia-2]